MVARCIIWFGITIVALGYSAPLPAGPIGDFLSNVAQDAKQRNNWPLPYVCADRDATRQVLAIQESAGWERQNLLSEFHFLPGGNELTEAGRMRVQLIMTEVPAPHRQIYVHRASTPQETVARMLAVQHFVTQSPYAANIPVLESTRTDEGSPADRIDALSRKAVTAAPDPKLMGAATTTK